VSYRIHVDQTIHERFPGYAVLVIYARGLTNGPSDDASVAALRAAEAAARAAFGEAKPQTHSHIAAWREAFGAFGAKPSRYPCSVEALLSRTLKGQDLPAINAVVDRYNAISIAHVLPVGGENLDALTSDLTLTFATGDEPFDTQSGGEVQIEHAEPGEVVWVDSSGVSCRRWNWRQCYRTRLTEETGNAWFVLDRLPPYSLDDLRAAGDALIASLREQSPDCEIETELIGPAE
jgi:DNA/RNA-binding domain of Phe-tRNA-synthetase-like protein